MDLIGPTLKHLLCNLEAAPNDFKRQVKIGPALQDEVGSFRGRTPPQQLSGAFRPSNVFVPTNRWGWPTRSRGWPRYLVRKARSDLAKRFDAEVQAATIYAKVNYKHEKARSSLVKAAAIQNSTSIKLATRAGQRLGSNPNRVS